jgi:hypothetical protein
MKETELSKAIKVLTKALDQDAGYRQAWISNIAMAFYDEHRTLKPTNLTQVHLVANRAAEAFLRNLCYKHDSRKS